MGGLGLIHHGLELFSRRAVDPVVLVHPCDGFVCRHFNHAQAVDFGKFLGFGQGCAGHAGQLVIKAEVVLEGDRGQRGVLRLDIDLFLGLDRLMQPLRKTAPRHHPSGEFINQHHLAIAHDVILVPLEQLMCPQSRIHMVHHSGAFRVIQ